MEDQPVIDQQVINLQIADQIMDQMIMEQEEIDQLIINPGLQITLKQNNGVFYPEVSCPLSLLEANNRNTKGLISRYLTDLLRKYTFRGKEYLIFMYDEVLEMISETADKFIDTYEYLMDNVGRENLEGPYDEDDILYRKTRYNNTEEDSLQ